MSPEQAEGQPVDSRSDIFSFGSMLYEMLMGRRAFQANSAAATLAAILHDDPPPPSDVPKALTRIVAGCLRKKPDERWQDMGDVKHLLDDVAKDYETTAAGDVKSTPGGRARLSKWPALIAACVAGGIMTYGALRMAPRAASSSGRAGAVLRMLTADDGLTSYPAISRDGKLVAFASDRAKVDNLDIWVHQIGGRDPIRLTQGPADASDPSFSPDGAMIAFRSEKDGGGVYVIPSLGGSATLLAPLGRNPRFSPDGRWITYAVGGQAVSNPGSAGVFIVSSGGGVPRAIHPEMATATHPVWSPGSDRLLVLGRKDAKAPARTELDWWILPIEGGSPQRTGAYRRLDEQNLMGTQFPQVFPVGLDWREQGGDRILFNALLG
jgi:hypothetical protein